MIGFPYPDNIALAKLLESVVRANGGVPATIGILGGIGRVGMSAEEIVELASTAEKKTALKVSRRDLGYICGIVCATLSTPQVNCKQELNHVFRVWQGSQSMVVQQSLVQ